MALYCRLVIGLLFLFTMQQSVAGIRQDNVLPPTFKIGEQTITPTKISEIYVHYTFDVVKQKVSAQSRVKFAAIADGLPFIDLIPDPQKVDLNGITINASDFYEVKTPQNETTVRVLNHFFRAGEKGVLDITYDLKKNVVFKEGGVGAGFFMTDLSDRGFFEQYGPANFEFDHIEFTFDIEVVDSLKPHEIFTNGSIRHDGTNRWHIVFPNYFTSSSIFFHVAPIGTFAVEKDTFESINKKQVPMTFFSPNADLAKKGMQDAKKYLAEFEEIFGEFGHNQVVVYVTPNKGGMEYPGAATSSIGALRHELNHSWFARCIMPASGNAGWIDEAIASWSDDGFPRATKMPDRSAVNMAGMPPFTRLTNRLAYTLGRDFIAELDLLFKDIGGMKKFLNLYYATYKYQVVSTTMMQKLAEQFYGKSLSSLFDRYVFGVDEKSHANIKAIDAVPAAGEINPYHVILSDEEQRALILPGRPQ